MINNKVAIAQILGAALGLAACTSTPAGPTPLQGIVEFDERVLAFEIPGRLRSVTVQEGDPVVPKAELAQLDDTLERLARDARAAEARAVTAELDLLRAGTRPEDMRSLLASLASAKATESLAKQTLERQRKLSNSQIGTAAELDAAQTNYATATAARRDLEARLARARHGARDQELAAAEARAEASEMAVRSADERIARHVLRSETAGVVLDVHLEPDEFVPVGLAVVTLGDIHHPYVDVFVPQARISELTLGAPVVVRVDSHQTPYEGTIEHIARETEFTPKFLFSERERPNLVLRVRVRIASPAGDLHAGIPAFVALAGEAP